MDFRCMFILLTTLIYIRWDKYDKIEMAMQIIICFSKVAHFFLGWGKPKKKQKTIMEKKSNNNLFHNGFLVFPPRKDKKNVKEKSQKKHKIYQYYSIFKEVWYTSFSLFL
jgi:hypothetical protein